MFMDARLELHRPRVELREVEQLIDQPRQAMGVPLRHREVPSLRLVRRRSCHFLIGTQDERQRSPELMGDIGEESGFEAVDF